MELFWRKGYEGTSLSDLTGALGITRPSLYAAFGNKEALFRTVLDRYEARSGTYRSTALKAPAAHEAATVPCCEGAVDLHGDKEAQIQRAVSGSKVHWPAGMKRTRYVGS